MVCVHSLSSNVQGHARLWFQDLDWSEFDYGHVTVGCYHLVV